MLIARKLNTAINVLKKNGLDQVFSLISDHLEAFFIHFGRLAVAKLRIIADMILFSATSSRKPVKQHERLRILYVTSLDEAENGQTVRYRIHNIRQALGDKYDTRFEVVEFGGVSRDYPFLWADLIVLMRLGWGNETENILKKAKLYDKPVVFDIDDIIFLTEYTKHFCRAISDESEEYRHVYEESFLKFEKTFTNCDFATTSTEYIADLMRQKGKTAYVIPNGVNLQQLRIARRVRGKDKRAGGVIRIAYLSGSKTHDRDFEQAKDAVVRILREYPLARLRVAGYLDIGDLPPELESRVERAVYMKYTRLLRYSAANTVNLAPLDTANPFCHAKSELKYFEAAIVGVPTVASPTDTFKRCIQSGANGILAQTPQEWYQAIKRLIDDRQFNRELCGSAYSKALEHYSPEAIAAQADSVYRSVLSQYHAMHP